MSLRSGVAAAISAVGLADVFLVPMFSVSLAEAVTFPKPASATVSDEGALLITTIAFEILKRLRASHLAFGHDRRCLAISLMRASSLQTRYLLLSGDFARRFLAIPVVQYKKLKI